MDPNLLRTRLHRSPTLLAQWQTAIFALGYPIFWMLAFIELGIVFALMIINRDLPGMIDDLVRSVIGIAVGYILFQNAADWMRNGVIATIAEWGGRSAAYPSSSLSPDGVLAAGWALASTLLKAMALGHWLTMPVTRFSRAPCRTGRDGCVRLGGDHAAGAVDRILRGGSWRFDFPADWRVSL